MGHHIENLDEMAHKDSREEARNRREEKKKKSKKARMTDDEVVDDNIDNVDEDGNQLLPESTTVRSKMLLEGGSGVVIIPIPRVSEETRKEIVKELGRQAENGRQRIRKIRRSAMDIVKKGKDGKLEGISKDDAFRVGKEVDSVTEEVLSVLNDIVDKKQKSVMED
ncbi:hypothetical protein QTG54_003025 [Skeletonema marinoi]|uniref:Ribosome recycling factor domain-containing protein n=1 Tax=Skeletonema marinoi TaxID=267567 RepID=A0AAD8YI32_9STRA|nr:hypothetical protein QTG54_003025 [Skeletonema marinoi]